MPASYPLWNDDTPHTDPKARPTRWRAVVDARVVVVKGAQYRGAVFDGTFELVGNGQRSRRAGPARVEVVCAWHGVKPKTTYLHVEPGAHCEFKERFEGEVVDNLG